MGRQLLVILFYCNGTYAQSSIDEGGNAHHGPVKDVRQRGQTWILEWVNDGVAGLQKAVESRRLAHHLGTAQVHRVAQHVQEAVPGLGQLLPAQLCDKTHRLVFQLELRVVVTVHETQHSSRQNKVDAVPLLDKRSAMPPCAAELAKRLPQVWRWEAAAARQQPHLEQRREDALAHVAAHVFFSGWWCQKHIVDGKQEAKYFIPRLFLNLRRLLGDCLKPPQYLVAEHGLAADHVGLAVFPRLEEVVQMSEHPPEVLVGVILDRLGNARLRLRQSLHPLAVDVDAVPDGLMLRKRQPQPKANDLFRKHSNVGSSLRIPEERW